MVISLVITYRDDIYLFANEISTDLNWRQIYATIRTMNIGIWLVEMSEFIERTLNISIYEREYATLGQFIAEARNACFHATFII